MRTESRQELVGRVAPRLRLTVGLSHPDYPKRLSVSISQSAERSISRRTAGITLIELLIVVAIVAMVAAIGISTGRGTAASQQESAAVRSIQQSVWQGATAASARGRETELVISGRVVLVREVESGVQIRREELPEAVTTNLPNLVFTPPGRIRADSLESLPDDLFIHTSKGQRRLHVSAIGEVLVEEML